MVAISSSRRPDGLPIAPPMTRLFQILTLLAILVILYMSLRPGVSTGGIQHADKLMHLLAYALMAGLARLGWPSLWGGWIVLGFIAMGVAIELAQHFMALGRTGSLADGLANAAGALLAICLFHSYRRRTSL